MAQDCRVRRLNGLRLSLLAYVSFKRLIRLIWLVGLGSAGTGEDGLGLSWWGSNGLGQLTVPS